MIYLELEVVEKLKVWVSKMDEYDIDLMMLKDLLTPDCHVT